MGIILKNYASNRLFLLKEKRTNYESVVGGYVLEIKAHATTIKQLIIALSHWDKHLEAPLQNESTVNRRFIY